MVNRKVLFASLPFLLIFLLFLINWFNNGHLPAPGQVIYDRDCAKCHMEAGQGLGRLYPPLAQSDYLNTHWDSIVCLIVNGQSGSIIVNQKEFNLKMPPNPSLTAIDLNNLLHFISAAWGNNLSPFTLEKVRDALHDCIE